MGWYYDFSHDKRRFLIEDRIRTWNNKDDTEGKTDHYFITETLKHCYRGNSFSGVLWSVKESKKFDRKNDELLETSRWICCDLLRWCNVDKCWGHKPMEESMHPYYYSCPLGYLELAPVENEEWRKNVKKYHEDRKLKFKIKKDMLVFSKDCYVQKAFKIVSVKPLLGVNYQGMKYTLPKKTILREVTNKEKEKAIDIYIKEIKKKLGFSLEDEADRNKVTDYAILDILDDHYRDFNPAN